MKPISWMAGVRARECRKAFIKSEDWFLVFIGKAATDRQLLAIWTLMKTEIG